MGIIINYELIQLTTIGNECPTIVAVEISAYKFIRTN